MSLGINSLDDAIANDAMLHAGIQAGLDALACVMTEYQVEQLETYVGLLVKWNKTYNLTAIKKPGEMLSLHLFDSLAVAPYLKGNSFLDVGSGGGLPGIPLAILQTDREFTLLDTVGKKTRFMQQAAIELKLPNVSVVQTRVESWSPDKSFDAIISRAFASLEDFVILASRHLHSQGRLYAMKGRYPKDELSALPEGYRVVAEYQLEVPQLDAERYLIEIKSRYK